MLFLSVFFRQRILLKLFWKSRCMVLWGYRTLPAVVYLGTACGAVFLAPHTHFWFRYCSVGQSPLGNFLATGIGANASGVPGIRAPNI